MSEKEILCSFCGRTKSQTKLLIAGLDAHICDICISQADLILKDELYKIIAKKSGQSVEKVNQDSDRDYWMKAEEAKEYGMVDEILGSEK